MNEIEQYIAKFYRDTTAASKDKGHH